MEDTWLQALEPAMKVIVHGVYTGSKVRVVHRITATQILVTNGTMPPRRFSRRNGWEIGKENKDGMYLAPYTDEEGQAIALRNQHKQVFMALQRLSEDVVTLTAPQCQELLAALRPYELMVAEQATRKDRRQ